MSPSPSPSPSTPHLNSHHAAVPPTLGSALLTHSLTHHHHLHPSLTLPQPPAPPAAAAARSGCAAIDQEVLTGGDGYRYGEITAIAGASGTGKTVLAYHAVASHLLGMQQWRGGGGEVGCGGGEEEGGRGGVRGGEVAWIDTSGSFSPVRLRDLLVHRLRAAKGHHHRGGVEGYGHSGGYVYEKHAGANRELDEDAASLIEEATGLLDMVKLMRVFDFAGLVEAVGEVGEQREERDANVRSDDAVRAMPKRTRHEVGDSEEEEEEEESGDEISKVGHMGEGGFEEMAGLEAKDIDKDGGVGMIIIDNITNVASAVVSRSPIHGQALLASFMRSLQYLTSRCQLCTILINSAVGVNPSANPEYNRRQDDNVSVFSSSLGKPALGKMFPYLIDTSIFLSILPQRRDDAVVAYGNIAEGRTWRRSVVLEVLKDRHGAREGRWTAFEIDGGVKLVPCSGYL